ncbi:hypothetical protein JCM21142_83140 [Saccharicrinis fermentans DSM 9555 = JCM 21142]|uniref:Uncharacterized protein n=1 Tax=Saccharicrinis fermentans DSM 9555 = JCM 21142 TaxID=869213 RepID=W7YIY4_9BACT|nr:hypothetical protein JCM21142_83140 [Saccharicrinis fermentans DSM 9555 = JCM 21142]
MGQCQKLGINAAYSCHANIFVNLNKENFTSTTPLNCLLKSITIVLKDSAAALVLPLSN